MASKPLFPMCNEIDSIYKSFQEEIEAVKNKHDLDKIRVKFLGRSSALIDMMKKTHSLSLEKKREIGIRLNKIKKDIQLQIKNLQEEIEVNDLKHKIESDVIDVTLLGRNFERGRMHPLTHTISLLKNIFYSMGFTHVDGPEIDNEWNNFTALNMHKYHPARQMHDTFYVEGNSEGNDETRNLLLRTHTSNVQVRHMLSHKPPLRVFSIGRVYRSDYDATHTPVFHQLECLVVNERSSILSLKGCLNTLLRLFFECDHIPTRFRTSYFPFTEPSFEVDIKCDRSKKNEIKIGSGCDWLEILGCGIVNSEVFANVGIDSSRYQGFALGVGIERLAMLKYNIPDVRSFFEGDLRWIKHYGF